MSQVGVHEAMRVGLALHAYDVQILW